MQPINQLAPAEHATIGVEQAPGAPRGQKRPFRPREVWAIRARLEMLGQVRNLALLNLAIDSKLRGCDLVSLKVSDVFSAGSIRERAMVIHKEDISTRAI